MIKKNRTRTINFSIKAEIILMKLGYLDGLKNLNKNKNLSELMSHLLIDKFDNPDMEKKFTIFQLNNVTRKRNSLDKTINNLADHLKELRGVKKKEKRPPNPPKRKKKQKKDFIMGSKGDF